MMIAIDIAFGKIPLFDTKPTFSVKLVVSK